MKAPRVQRRNRTDGTHVASMKGSFVLECRATIAVSVVAGYRFAAVDRTEVVQRRERRRFGERNRTEPSAKAKFAPPEMATAVRELPLIHRERDGTGASEG